MRADVVVGHRVIRGHLFVETEAKQRLPHTRDFSLQEVMRAVARDPEIFVWCSLHGIAVEHEWRRQRESSKANVGDEACVVYGDEQQLVRAWQAAAGGQVPYDARGEPLHGKAQAREHVAKQQILFEAVAAAPLIDELREYRCRIQRDFAAEP